MDENYLRTMANEPKQDHYYSVLARMVSAVSQDHAQLRSLVYEFARRKLRKDLYPQLEDGDWAEIQKRVLTLETAIDQIEETFSQSVTRLSSETEPALTDGTDLNSSTTTPPIRAISQKELIVGDFSGRALPSFLQETVYDIKHSHNVLTVIDQHNRSPSASRSKYLQSRSWLTIQLIVAVGLGVAIYSAIDSRTAFDFISLHRFGHPTNTKAPDEDKRETNAQRDNDSPRVETKSASRSGVSGIPLPSSYGVYVVSDGKLIPLDLLPIKVPDSRIAMSATISTPSLAHVPLGMLQFVSISTGSGKRRARSSVGPRRRASDAGTDFQFWQGSVHKCRTVMDRSQHFLPNERSAGG